MIRPTLLTLTLLTVCATAHAQAPTGVYAWPTPHTLRRGEHLLITTKSDLAISPCHLRSIDAAKITCAGRHHTPPTTFDRDLIALIADAPREWPHPGFRFLKVTLPVFTVGLGCVLLGGCTVCGAMFLAGILGSLGGALAVSYINFASTLHGLPSPNPIYIAPQAA